MVVCSSAAPFIWLPAQQVKASRAALNRGNIIIILSTTLTTIKAAVNTGTTGWLPGLQLSYG